MLPGTLWIRVALLPVTEWLVWNSAVTLDFSHYLADIFGLSNPLRISFLNSMFEVSDFRLSQNSTPCLKKAYLSPFVSWRFGP